MQCSADWYLLVALRALQNCNATKHASLESATKVPPFLLEIAYVKTVIKRCRQKSWDLSLQQLEYNFMLNANLWQTDCIHILSTYMLLWFWIQAPSFDDELWFFGSIQSFSYLSISHFETFLSDASTWLQSVASRFFARPYGNTLILARCGTVITWHWLIPSIRLSNFSPRTRKPFAILAVLVVPQSFFLATVFFVCLFVCLLLCNIFFLGRAFHCPPLI